MGEWKRKKRNWLVEGLMIVAFTVILSWSLVTLSRHQPEDVCETIKTEWTPTPGVYLRVDICKAPANWKMPRPERLTEGGRA